MLGGSNLAQAATLMHVYPWCHVMVKCTRLFTPYSRKSLGTWLVYATMLSRLSQLRYDKHARSPLPNRRWSDHFFFRPQFLSTFTYFWMLLCIYLFVYLFICLSIYLSVYWSTQLFIYLFIYLLIYLSVCFFICLLFVSFINLFIYSFIPSFIHSSFIHS